MIEFVDVAELKHKFASVISKLYHEAHIGIDNINHKIVNSDYFSFLENNDLDAFLKKTPEDIIKDLFGEVIIFDFVDEIGELYWSGLQYMNIFLNTSLPLKVIFLLLPLKEMISLYKTYHEMNESKLVNRFLEFNLNISILKTLRLQKDYSLRELSILSKIPEATLKSYELSNKLLWSASFTNIKRLSDALEVNDTFFRRESNFIPLSKEIVQYDTQFKNYFSESLCDYYKLEARTFDILLDENDKQPNKIFLGIVSTLNVTTKKRIIIQDKVLLKLLEHTFKKLLSNRDINELIF